MMSQPSVPRDDLLQTRPAVPKEPEIIYEIVYDTF